LVVLLSQPTVKTSIIELILVLHDVVHPDLPILARECIVDLGKDQSLELIRGDKSVSLQPEPFLLMYESCKLERDSFRDLREVMGRDSFVNPVSMLSDLFNCCSCRLSSLGSSPSSGMSDL